MKIIVFGGTGRIGQRVAAEASSRGHSVTAGVRHAASEGPDWVPTAAVDIDAPATIAPAAAGHDAAVSTVGPTGGDDPEILVRAARALLTELPKAGVTRLVVLGGAGSLEVARGVRLVDTPGFPEPLKPLGLAHAEALEAYRQEGDALDWTYLSPPPFVGPGERTGRYRTGTDAIVGDPGGSGYLSIEDLAVAIVDELERPRFIRRRFTVGPVEDAPGSSGQPLAEASVGSPR